MITINQLIHREKRPLLHLADYNESVRSVLDRMLENDLSAMLVMNDGHLVGIFSQKDYMRRGLPYGLTEYNTHVGDVMRKRLTYVTVDYTLDQCVELMLHKKIQQVPVFEKNEFLCLITLNEVTMALIEDQAHNLSELTRYITGDRVSDKIQNLIHDVKELTWTSES